MDSSTTHDTIPSEEPGWGKPLLLAAVIFAVYFFLSCTSTIWDRDEARFARATAEMISSGNYLVPTYNGHLRADKPILIYWLMSVPVKLFGHREWAYRLCSVLGTVLTCLFTYFIGRKLYNHRVGLWGMALMGATPMMVYTGAVATSDAVLLAFITGGLAVFADSLKSGLCLRRTLLLTLFFAGGMLTKGPVALIGAIPFILTRVLLRNELSGSMAGAIAKILLSVAGGFLAFIAWFYPANVATKGDLYDFMFVHHVVDRALTPLENHGGYSPKYMLFYFVVIMCGFFPWTLYLPGALARFWKGEGEFATNRPGRVLLLSWMLSFLLIMIAVSTKLPHYILPMWPALSICVGCLLAQAERENARSPGAGWTVLGGALFFVATIAACGAMSLGPEFMGEWSKKPDALWKPFASDSRSVRSVFGALGLLIALPVLFRHQIRHFAANARILFCGGIVVALFVGLGLMPALESVKLSAPLAEKIRPFVSAGAPVTVCGFTEASFLFHVNGNVEEIIPPPPDWKPGPAVPTKNAPKIIEKAVVDWANKSGPGILIIPKPMYEKFKTNSTMPELLQVGEVHGLLYSKGQWVDILALRRPN